MGHKKQERESKGSGDHGIGEQWGIRATHEATHATARVTDTMLAKTQ
ncbi:MAG: hypothetical protein ACI87O_002597 [Planctomycetota bacterium]